MAKTKPHFSEERLYWNCGIPNVIGLDEVGRGAFAGPIVAAGVIYKPYFKASFLAKVNDSKLVNPKLREELSEYIKNNSVWVIESVGLDFINQYGIGKANHEVFRKVIASLIPEITDDYFILVDGFDLKMPKQKAITKGDRQSLSIASASIIAKVYRDNLMREASSAYPNYNLKQNKGYGTKFHRDAIKNFGLCDLHRTSFNLNRFMQA